MSDATPIDVEGELPEYSPSSPTPPAGRSVHTYTLTDKRQHSWATLQVSSHRYTLPDQLPQLTEGEPVEGTVSLDLKEEESIKGVHVSVVGELLSEPNTRFFFANVTQELWSSVRGDPSSPPSTSEKGTIIGNSPKPFKGKLVGKYSWPFSLVLPRQVELPVNGELKPFNLPQHLYMRWARSDIVYRVTAKILYNSMLRPDHVIGTNVGYTPVTRPSAPSALRQLAYEQKTPIPGPEVDPEGWASLPSVAIHGEVFGNRKAQVDYTLALAKPLSYTRGTTIPLHLTIRSSDAQALDLLADPSAPLVRLRRIMRDNYDAGGSSDQSMWSGKEQSLASLKQPVMMKFQDLVGYISSATWWSVPSTGDDPNTKTLQGELHIPTSSRANVNLGLFRYFYDVVIFTPRATAFSPTTSKNESLQAVEVEVATVRAPGPQAISYSPPSYEDETKPVEETRGTYFNRFTAMDLYF